MILVDTSIWIDHLRTGRPALEQLLEDGLVLAHPSVIGELALGHLSNREEVLGLLGRLPEAAVTEPAEVLTFIERHELHGLGIGYVDVKLLAATQFTSEARLWTDDKRLAAAASRLNLDANPRGPTVTPQQLER